MMLVRNIFFLLLKCFSKFIPQHDNNAGEGKNLKLVDAPVSGGVTRASRGTLTV